ncbi:MAG: TetR family transcriptional regulator [Polaromonas sp.]|uniref:TetR family transcriptional regulator n=1 Tax=Polaromonas sp. TaxID=1869339 RepID=UPI00248891DB|nr:TetR family transcriptional regulator [Polaromonas sp.]MDI1268972.1 TetR family transcriptional regulator [Polaromonas sp.]MDO9112771.1 TetR family transcriptional regulator [Polaromonas sp.]MDP1887990.1 TetR family transcriptional regulator [Polaromonas sp.]MDP2451611.1 TetR family transcriptional regulator [Polaromonas sp.]MDP3247499.1 TetR family transcriptional regulator [Polaromonas sp.]
MATLVKTPDPALTPRRDASVARAALIAAAVAEFSRKGFAGARVDEIAAAAGVNKQLVYHYFDSKQGLYLVALESVYAEIREKEQKLSLGALEPMEAMAQLVGFSFDYLAEHPEFIALLTDENRNQGSHILASERLQKMHSPFIEMLEATLERGVAAGVFRADFDAINLYISIAGISYFFFSNNHTLSAIFGKPLGSRGALVQRRRHVIDFALNALRP